jgi:NAD-dependent SIR2 family protein deacetylase
MIVLFGAGASHAEGAPLQRDILPFILEESSHITSSATGRQVRDFLANYFAWDSVNRIYPNLEVVFAFLDYLIYKKESLGGQHTNEYIRNIRESLIKLIHYSVWKVSAPRTGVYKKFWERVAQSERNITVFTTNYDTFIDEAFGFLYPQFGYLDYCIRLMNYDYFQDIEAFNWWISPSETASVSGEISSRPIKLIKLHGSLNWKYCNCCNEVLLTPWHTAVNLEEESFGTGEYPPCDDPDAEGLPCACPHDGTPFQTLIVPPAHLKTLDHPTLHYLMSEAAREIRMARKIVFIGYSFPDADVHLKVLFSKNLNSDTEVVVINREKDIRIQKSYESLTRKVRFIWGLFEEIVSDASLMEDLLER